ncbi:hypothetical protein M2444_004651 [Paenibacillus sp. PastF-3]|uniref:DUF1257 domain-containing protein n=1 Tax=unclassified Paenibacillus TaxID=185978 RepID=UPI000B9FC02F|nr:MULTISPECIES: DUF1257 domain-containing protein [unclassified Paenibacillus]MDH6372822.1 hypothetical protein [Paenibacillus sp. PastF-3]OZQ97397.1 hypothetical protein CA598_06275 [Paenibacillus sp. VTT E-133291]
MSHYSTIQMIITNIPALKTAAEALELLLIENGICRGYTRSQDIKADYVIQLKGPYDVAVIKGQNGAYSMETDWWAGHVEKEIGKNGGRLLQEYGIAVTIQKARKQGHTVHRKVAADGTVKLQVTVSGL